MRLLGVLAALLLALAGGAWFLLRREVAPASSGSAATSPASTAGHRPPAEPAGGGALAEAGPRPVPIETAPRPGVIRGSVRDDHGVPLHEEVRVVALDGDGEVVASTRVDTSGDFELSSFGLAAVRIEPRKEGWFARESPLIAGLRGEVQLVLERGGKIAGSLLLDERGSLGAFVRATGADDHARWRLGEIRPDGSFEIDGLDRGEHDFELVGDGRGVPVGALFRIPGVVVRRGETTRDPRLQALVLDALVRAVQVTVLDPEGALAAGAMVHVLEREGGVLARAPLERELVSLPVPADRLVDALVVHHGFRPALVTLDFPYAQVVLERGIRVFLRPTRPVQLDRGSVGASLRLRPELPGIETWPEGVCDVELPMTLGSEPVTEAVFPFPGHYRLLVALRQRTGTQLGSTPGTSFAPLDEGFDVVESDAGKRRDFWMPPDLFEQAERAARAR